MVFFYLITFLLFANSPFQWKFVSEAQIEEWLGQFALEDREIARKLIDYIDFYDPGRFVQDLKSAHQKLMNHLQNDGFFSLGEDPYEQVDFSRVFCAKSGDVVSYYYRQANGLRAASFKNLSDLVLETKGEEKRALVLLEDYIGSGTQFIWECYAKKHLDLFNQYERIYLVVLSANQLAVSRFEQLKDKDFKEFSDFLVKMQEALGRPMTLEAILKKLDQIHFDRLNLIYVKKEISLPERIDIPLWERNQIASLISKYTPHQYLDDLFSIQGSTVFFYNCTNNVPSLLWNKKNAPGWKPLFYRYEDLSVYDNCQHLPVTEQTW